MSLTLVTQPAIQTAVYNPITYLFSSDVRDNYTIGAELSVGAGNITNTTGYVTFFSPSHGLLQGDFILVTDQADITNLLGVVYITQLIDVNTFVTNIPFTITNGGDVKFFKYYNNYNAIIRVYGYFDCIADYGLLAKIQLRPFFDGGFCNFYIDIADILKDFNSDCNTASGGISSDLYPLSSILTYQNNEQSFLKFYISYAEGFDNPVGTDAEYIETPPTDL
jgi:hypothetical protein